MTGPLPADTTFQLQPLYVLLPGHSPSEAFLRSESACCIMPCRAPRAPSSTAPISPCAAFEPGSSTLLHSTDALDSAHCSQQQPRLPTTAANGLTCCAPHQAMTKDYKQYIQETTHQPARQQQYTGHQRKLRSPPSGVTPCLLVDALMLLTNLPQRNRSAGASLQARGGCTWKRAGSCACSAERVSAKYRKGSTLSRAGSSSSSSVHSSSDALSSCRLFCRDQGAGSRACTKNLTFRCTSCTCRTQGTNGLTRQRQPGARLHPCKFLGQAPLAHASSA